ncbi:MAG: 16S rRNA (guanine(966)-N(2))-methyltransferase RsmD [Pseudomonadota bacterium]
MRIIGGTNRGLTLASVGKGDETGRLRPTADRVRESVFNILQNGSYGDVLTDSHVLDLFAGTGALSFEAISRGARSAVLVENGRTAATLIADNAARMRAQDRIRVLRKDATRLPPSDGSGAQIVFLDPPYGKGLGEPALISALTQGWIAPNALVVWEENAPSIVPGDFTKDDERHYGDTCISFLRAPR